MMNTANIFPAMMGAFGLVFVLLLFVLAAIWIALPFSVFGIKDLLREAIEEQKKTNELLKELLKEKPEVRSQKREENHDAAKTSPHHRICSPDTP